MASNRQGRSHMKKDPESVSFVGPGCDRDKALARQSQEAGAISTKT